MRSYFLNPKSTGQTTHWSGKACRYCI